MWILWMMICAALQAQFAQWPPLSTETARRLGQQHDGDLDPPAVARVAPVGGVEAVASMEVGHDALQLAPRERGVLAEVRDRRLAHEMRELQAKLAAAKK